MIHPPLAFSGDALLGCAFFSIPFVLAGVLVGVSFLRDRRRRLRWSVAALTALAAWILVFILLPCLLKPRVVTGKKLEVNNLRLIEHAIDEILVESNFSSTAAITIDMVNQRLKAGAISNMNWCVGAVPPDEKAIQASESNALSVVVNGRTITTGRREWKRQE